MPLLRCTVLCWVVTGCTDGIIDYETGEDIPYTSSYTYTRPNTTSYTRPNTSSYTQPNTSSYTRPNTNSYTRPNTSSYTRPNTSSYAPSNTRIEVYKTLIQACKERMVLENRRAEFNIENVTYKQIATEFRKFSLVQHPDKGGNEEIFKAGNGTWTDLKKELLGDKLIEQDLKTKGALLTYLETYLE